MHVPRLGLPGCGSTLARGVGVCCGMHVGRRGAGGRGGGGRFLHDRNVEGDVGGTGKRGLARRVGAAAGGVLVRALAAPGGPGVCASCRGRPCRCVFDCCWGIWSVVFACWCGRVRRWSAGGCPGGGGGLGCWSAAWVGSGLAVLLGTSLVMYAIFCCVVRCLVWSALVDVGAAPPGRRDWPDWSSSWWYLPIRF